MVKAVFAYAENGAFGELGGLPWPSIPEDLKLFKQLTQDTTLVMGRKTYETLPFKPTGTRKFLVAGTGRDVLGGNLQFIDPRNLVEYLTYYGSSSNYTIIGGSSLLVPEVLKICKTIYVSHIEGSYKHDVEISKRTRIWLEGMHSETIVWCKDKFTCKRYIINE
jgi:dihydrofolate reductase